MKTCRLGLLPMLLILPYMQGHEEDIQPESVCPMRIPVGSREEKGFDLILAMGIPEKAQKVRGSLLSEEAYLLSLGMDTTMDTRLIFPKGLPPSYVFVATVRLRAPTNQERFHLLRVQSKGGFTQAAVTLDGRDKSVTFMTTSAYKGEQSVIFNDRGIKRLFDENWHQLKLLVKPRRIICFLDDVQIEEQLLKQTVPIYINGRTQVAKETRAETTIPIEIQKLRLYCDPQQSERETACEIYSVRKLGACGMPGSPELTGPKGGRTAQGSLGKFWRRPPRSTDEAGWPGSEGPSSPEGSKEDRGEQGVSGKDWDDFLGSTGDRGEQGVPGKDWDDFLGSTDEAGWPVSEGPSSPEGSKGKLGGRGMPRSPGLTGPKGEAGRPGLKGPSGQKGGDGGEPVMPAGVWRRPPRSTRLIHSPLSRKKSQPPARRTFYFSAQNGARWLGSKGPSGPKGHKGHGGEPVKPAGVWCRPPRPTRPNCSWLNVDGKGITWKKGHGGEQVIPAGVWCRPPRPMRKLGACGIRGSPELTGPKGPKSTWYEDKRRGGKVLPLLPGYYGPVWPMGH